MSLSQAKDLATIIGTVIALAALTKGVVEYVAQGAQKRAEQFFEMSERLFADPSYKKIYALLNEKDASWTGVSLEEKIDFLGLFEEVAIMLNSGLVRESIAHYMFGYYALRCWNSDGFWSDMNRDGIYWQVFKHFARRMQAIENKAIKEQDKPVEDKEHRSRFRF